MYFNEEPFPRNESDERAHRWCSNEKGKILAPTATWYGAINAAFYTSYKIVLFFAFSNCLAKSELSTVPYTEVF